jgi:NADPH:quinone reductase-like Zn-dependent oxidoreductase
MKAIVCTKYGPPEVLQFKDVEKPVPGKNEVLIKVHAAAVTISDCIVRSGKINLLFWIPMRIFVGFKGPRNPILGLELSGEIEALGENAKRFQKGDHVIAFTGKRFGAYAEYVCLPEDGVAMPGDAIIVTKPANTTWEEAAALPARGALAMHYLEQGNIKNGQKVLIYGASGVVGTFVVQIAKHFGVTVIGVCGGKNLELVKSLGANKVIDYTKEDFTKKEDRYDLIFDAVGNRYSSKLNCRKALTPNGKFISVDDGTPRIKADVLLRLKELMEAGKLKPIIDRCYPPERAVEAHQYVETGHKRGNILITFFA